MLRMVAIGAYGSDRASFLERLGEANVRLLFDVRQRRSVRGPDYAWANSLRLQCAVAQAGIVYAHHLELAPPLNSAGSSTRRTPANESANARASSSRPNTPAAHRRDPRSRRHFPLVSALPQAAPRRYSVSSAPMRRVSAR